MATDKSTHEQRRHSQRLKKEWTQRIVDGTSSFEDLVAAAQGNSKDAEYLGSILLIDLLLKVHPALTRAQALSQLETLPLKRPSDPARASVRSVRLRPELVTEVSAMLKASAVTKNARGRTDVPTNWPWGTKLSDLIRANNGHIPQGLEWLETGVEDGDDIVEDLLLSAPDLPGADLNRAGERGAEPASGDEALASVEDDAGGAGREESSQDATVEPQHDTGPREPHDERDVDHDPVDALLADLNLLEEPAPAAASAAADEPVSASRDEPDDEQPTAVVMPEPALDDLLAAEFGDILGDFAK